jgi:hypothetical protein
MILVARNVWGSPLSPSEFMVFDADKVNAAAIGGALSRLQAESVDEHKRALHLVKAMPRLPGK